MGAFDMLGEFLNGDNQYKERQDGRGYMTINPETNKRIMARIIHERTYQFRRLEAHAIFRPVIMREVVIIKPEWEVEEELEEHEAAKWVGADDWE